MKLALGLVAVRSLLISHALVAGIIALNAAVHFIKEAPCGHSDKVLILVIFCLTSHFLLFLSTPSFKGHRWRFNPIVPAVV